MRIPDVPEIDLSGYEVDPKVVELVPASLDNWPVVPEDAWLANPIEEEDIWNPVSAIRQVDIPVLAIYGDKDSLGDPFQGAYAYQKALSEIGNPKSRVEVIPNADHIIINSKTGCMDELQKTVLRSFLWFAITHGATSLEKINAEIAKDPYEPGLLDFIPFAPGYLDSMENWLKDLYADGQ